MKVSGPRKHHYGPGFFLAPEIVKMGLFLAPEIVNMTKITFMNYDLGKHKSLVFLLEIII